MGRQQRILFGFLFLVLLLPLLNQNFAIIKSGPLQGYYTNASDTDFSIDGWITEKFQKKRTDFLNDHTGFREDMVRLSGQLDYSLFRNVNYGGTIATRDNNVYYMDHIESYIGVDYIGHDRICSILNKVRALQDTFTKMGKTFVVVYAANKAYYYRERMPSFYQCVKKGPANLEEFVHVSDSLGIHHINMNGWMAGMFGKTKDSVFTKEGIHWTEYAGLLAGDSLARYMEKDRNIKMPHPYWTEIEHVQQGRRQDKDLTNILNLIYPFATETFSYPKVRYTTDSQQKKLHVIFIGDSFTATLIDNGFVDNEFDKWEAWLWFKFIRDRRGIPYDQNPIGNYDWFGALGQTDVVVLLYTTKSLPTFGSGFIEQAYAKYFPGKS